MTSAAPHSVATTRNPKMNSVNLNHLLNFTLPPRQVQPLPRRSRRTGTNQGVWNKERFVNAQYRFVMDPTGDYTVHFADPDIFFQWQDILQVIIPRASAFASAATGEEQAASEGRTTCPICLSPPIAPRMTKCGHLYCFPCILHYLNTSENKWARCPICFDSVNEKQLKSVHWFDEPFQGAHPSLSPTCDGTDFETAPLAGSLLQMRLMQRPQISTLALPRSATWPSDLLPSHQAPFHFLPDVFNFAKFMLATPEYLIKALSQDLDELEAERRVLAGMADDLSISFIDSAVTRIHDQLTKAANLRTPLLEDQIEKAKRELNDVQRRQVHNALYQGVHPSPVEFLTPKNQHPTKSLTNRHNPRQRRNVNPPEPSRSTYYYYQAASGLPLFLHPLDIRILLSHFHVYSSFPDTITIRVEACTESTVNDDLRKRCKYLANMPEGADVVFIEADLEDVVGREGLRNFDSPLKMRTARRKEKGRKDDRAKMKAEEREREKRTAESFVSWNVPSTPQILIVEPEEEFLPLPSRPEQAASVSTAPLSGAWGARSFASALHSTQSPRRAPVVQPTREEDEWDVDAAWHELEQRNSGGRKKRSNKLVVLGSGRRR